MLVFDRNSIVWVLPAVIRNEHLVSDAIGVISRGYFRKYEFAISLAYPWMVVVHHEPPASVLFQLFGQCFVIDGRKLPPQTVCSAHFVVWRIKEQEIVRMLL